jgi:hypothetical protein
MDIYWLPDQNQIRFFREHGWLITPKILPNSLIDDAIYGVKRLYAGEKDSRLPLSGGYLDWQPVHGDGIRINDYVSLQNQEIAALVHWEHLAKIAASLVDTKLIRLFHDQLVCKPTYQNRSTAVCWHTDQAYWTTCSSVSLLTAWIPLEEYQIESGGLQIIDGSHLWEDHSWMRTFNDTNLEALKSRITPRDTQVPMVKQIQISPGQVSFHHAQIIHGSQPNLSNKMRIALTVHYQPRDNHYIPVTLADGKRALHVNDLLCRKQNGQPDYHDPVICPVLWKDL